MRGLAITCLHVSLVLASSTSGFADDELLIENDAPAPLPIEVGAYAGAFISNYYHQFYDPSKFPGVEGTADFRPELRRVSPLAGVRFAYFFLPWLGGEADLSMVVAETKGSSDHPMAEAATIYSGRLQAIFQAPSLSKYVVPYVSIGDGFGHVSSDYLGSDTDFPPFIGAGARFLVTPSITLRVDGRWMRAPTPSDAILDCNLGELMLGVSFRPGSSRETPPPPPPPKDSDGDGITDDADRCPNEAEDPDLFDDSDGCPDLDNDSDGVADAQDRCPLDAEDKDGFQDDDGCVDADNDRDTVPDAQDRCPNEPEDVDGFEDEDGCPELDNDGDGFADAQDTCPSEAEVINGVEDEDGCPDKGNSLVVVSPDRLEALEAFAFKKAAIAPASKNLLAQLGATLRAHPEILRLRISVHVQPTKKADADLQLTERRAAAIRDWLVTYGISDSRLEPRGFGGTTPLVEPKTKGAKGINERVELIVVERR